MEDDFHNDGSLNGTTTDDHTHIRSDARRRANRHIKMAGAGDSDE